MKKINKAWVFGVPIQFFLVALFSFVLFIYFVAAIADSRIEERANTLVKSNDIQSSYAWEKAALWACPLH